MGNSELGQSLASHVRFYFSVRLTFAQHAQTVHSSALIGAKLLLAQDRRSDVRVSAASSALCAFSRVLIAICEFLTETVNIALTAGEPPSHSTLAESNVFIASIRYI